MANFDDGVKRYIKAHAVVEVSFPVDWRDKAEIACKHCQFYVRATQRCGLNQQVVNYPDSYIGHDCPLVPIDEKEEETDEV